MIRRFFSVFTSLVGVTLIVTLILSACIWAFGPFLAVGGWRPLDGLWERVIAIVVLWLLAILTIVLVRWRRKARDHKISAEIVEAVADPGDAAVQSEIQDLRGKLRTALAQLSKSKLGRHSLYQLPWYVVIGPPGAGKTTAVVNSGLQFPLADEFGRAALGGVGGTRNCDWWFTNDAVLLDTAGRYTTQDSDSEADSAAWVGFLGLLKKHRKRQPINGALVAISLSDLSLQDETTRLSHARAVRRRLQELREKLGVRFPVYVLFTKADLIAGFAEFFDGLGKEERQQVWGFTLPLDTGKAEASPVAAFGLEFDGLLAQLNAQSLERMQTESDPQRRSLIAGFPSQVASLRQIAGDFLKEVFQDSRFEDRHMLRGVYLTSGTQEGTPIDRLMMGMARTFGIGRQAIGTGQGTGRSFFLTRLLQDVIFPEAGLVSADDKVERRYRWVKRGAIAAAVLIALGFGTVWTRSFLGNRDLLAQAAESVGEYQAAARAIPPSPVGDTDLPAVVPALDILRAMPGNPTPEAAPPPSELTWGLYQGDVIGSQAAQTYRAALNQHFLPRLMLRLEEQLQGNMNNPDLLYEALKIYLMLGAQGPMDKELVSQWMTIDWSLAYPGPSREQLRSDLAAHLNSLLSQPMKPVELNGPLVEQVQGILAQMPLAQRIYNGIINSQAAKDLPNWRLVDVAGPSAPRVLTRSSGKTLADGIPGIYTYDGFRQVFLREALQVAQRVQRESWVLGPAAEAEQSELALAAMSRDVLDIYYNDYIAAYDGVLGDVDIVPLESLSHAVEVTNVLSGPTSPIVNILNAIATETRLAEDRSVVDTSSATEGAADIANLELQSQASLRERMLLDALLQATPINGQDATPQVPGAYVEERFEWLQQLVERPEGLPSQLDAVMSTLQEVYNELNRMAMSSGGALGAPGDGTALQRFQQEAGRLQGPMARWATQIGTGSSGITAAGTRARLNDIWTSQVLPFCELALTDRYPFNARAEAEISASDFAKLFAPGGLIDTFVTENLLRLVDTTTTPWTWKTVNDAELGLSPAVLEQMQNAAEIRDAFFTAGAAPSVSFEMKPYSLDTRAQAVSLDIDGTEVAYQHGGQINPVRVTWPGAVGNSRITLQPPLPGIENTLVRDGPWAWFRLLSAAEVRRLAAPDQRRVIFSVGGRTATFDMRSGSALNPFGLPALSEFNCPKSL